MRTFQKLGSPEEFLAGTVVQRDYQWCNGDGEVLLELTYDDPGVSGWAELYMMYQPELESVLDARCRLLESVDIRQGVAVVKVVTQDNGVQVMGRSAQGQDEIATGRYLVGCDGGNSFVRRTLGSVRRATPLRKTG